MGFDWNSSDKSICRVSYFLRANDVYIKKDEKVIVIIVDKEASYRTGKSFSAFAIFGPHKSQCK